VKGGVRIYLKGFVLIELGPDLVLELELDIVVVVLDQNVFGKLDVLAELDASTVAVEIHLASHLDIVSEGGIGVELDGVTEPDVVFEVDPFVKGKIVVVSAHPGGAIEHGHAICIAVEFDVFVKDHIVVEEGTVLEANNVSEIAAGTKGGLSEHRQALAVGSL